MREEIMMVIVMVICFGISALFMAKLGSLIDMANGHEEKNLNFHIIKEIHAKYLEICRKWGYSRHMRTRNG